MRLASPAAGAIRCRGFTRGVAQLGSALRSGRRGRGFESRHPDSIEADQRQPPAVPLAVAFVPVEYHFTRTRTERPQFPPETSARLLGAPRGFAPKLPLQWRRL